MKSHGFVGGSGAVSDSVTRPDTTVAFLVDRRQSVAMVQSERMGAAYVWRRVFLKGRMRRP